MKKDLLAIGLIVLIVGLAGFLTEPTGLQVKKLGGQDIGDLELGGQDIGLGGEDVFYKGTIPVKWDPTEKQWLEWDPTERKWDPTEFDPTQRGSLAFDPTQRSWDPTERTGWDPTERYN